jgi:hypothetical protein
MFSIGLLFFFIGWFFAIKDYGKGFKGSTTVRGFAGWGIILGIFLMVLSIVIHLWKVLP